VVAEEPSSTVAEIPELSTSGGSNARVAPKEPLELRLVVIFGRDVVEAVKTPVVSDDKELPVAIVVVQLLP